jgi:cobalt-zinc-cadmium efflux system protein
VLTFTIWIQHPPKWLIHRRHLLARLLRQSEERLWKIGNSINTLLLLAAALYTIVTALVRWRNGETVTDPASSFVIAIIGLLINGLNLLIYNAYQAKNHLRSVYAHILTDLVSSLAVIISLGVYALYRGPFWIDSALSLLLGIWMIGWSWNLAKMPYPGDGCGCDGHRHGHH